jgi:hypothetical protein
MGGSRLAQQFSLSSPAYISRIDLMLSFGGLGGITSCTFSVAITQSLSPDGGYGSPVLERSESTGALVSSLLSDSFPAILLPAGTYFLVVDETSGTSPCNTTLPNAPGIIFYLVSWDTVSLGSSAVGTVGLPFAASPGPWEQVPNALNPPQPRPSFSFWFDLAGPIIVPPPTGGGSGQIARLVVEGPVTPAPGGPVEAQIGFVDPATGTPVAPLSPVTLNTGQTQSVDVALSSLGTRLGQHVDLLPVIAQLPGAAQSSPIQLSASVQMLDAITGFGTVLSRALQPGAPVPALGPQILAGGQTMRVNVVAGSDPCVGQVGFNDLNGNSLVPSSPVNLSPGTGKSIDLNADSLSLRLGQRIEAQPALTVTQPTAAVPLNSVCQASVEVFDHLTGRTWTYQSTMAALPCLQCSHLLRARSNLLRPEFISRRTSRRFARDALSLYEGKFSPAKSMTTDWSEGRLATEAGELLTGAILGKIFRHKDSSGSECFLRLAVLQYMGLTLTSSMLKSTSRRSS